MLFLWKPRMGTATGEAVRRSSHCATSHLNAFPPLSHFYAGSVGQMRKPSGRQTDNGYQVMASVPSLPGVLPDIIHGFFCMSWVTLFAFLSGSTSFPTASIANTIHWHNVDWMLGQHRREWANIEPTLCQCIVFAEIHMTVSCFPPYSSAKPKSSICLLVK